MEHSASAPNERVLRVTQLLQSWVSTTHRSYSQLTFFNIFIKYGVCELNLRYGYLCSASHFFYRRSFARVLLVVYFILMKYIGRWLPWTLPGSTGQFSYFIKSWKTSAVSTIDWMVKTQLCKLRGTYSMFQFIKKKGKGFCELSLRYGY